MTFDRGTLNELLLYTDYTWGAYARVLPTLPGDAFRRPVEGSGWPAIADALFHIAGAWDGWLRDAAGVDYEIRDEDEYKRSWRDLDDYRALTRSWLRAIVDGTSDDDLSVPRFPITRPSTEGGAQLMASTGEIITHLLLHERGHHGDVSTLIHQLGGSPPPTDYLGYLVVKLREADR